MMRIKSAVLTLAVAAVFALGCDHATQSPVGPDGIVESPQASKQQNNSKKNLARSRTRVTYVYSAVEIGPNGGVVQADGHTLEIRAGAVLTPTWFVIVVPAGDNILVDLYAYDAATQSRVTEFPANTVYLTLSYSNAAAAPSSRFGIGYLPDRETIVPLPSDVDAGALAVRTMLTHFSEYALILE